VHSRLAMANARSDPRSAESTHRSGEQGGRWRPVPAYVIRTHPILTYSPA